jgi:hypothetical protein
VVSFSFCPFFHLPFQSLYSLFCGILWFCFHVYLSLFLPSVASRFVICNEYRLMHV